MAKFLGKIEQYSYVAFNTKVIKLNIIKVNRAISKLDNKCKITDNYDKLIKFAYNIGDIKNPNPKFYLLNPFD